MRPFLLVLAIATLTAPAYAGDRQGQITAAFEQWLEAHDVPDAAIAIIEGDARAPTFTKGYARDPDAPVTLASLSKALTGACIAVLQQEGVFDLDAELSDLIDVPEGSGRLPGLLSQTSGLTQDVTQGQPWHLEEDRTPRHMLATTLALEAPRGDASFRYNNANYAALGAVIDAVAQQDYEADCRSLLLDPLGVTTATLDPVWGPLAAWGGWAMSVGDYARFVKEWYSTDRNIGRDPLSWPHADLGGGAYYIMGAFHRQIEDRNLFWHAGLLCWDGVGDGSYFASYGGDPVVVVSYKGCIEDTALRALDEALFLAAMR